MVRGSTGGKSMSVEMCWAVPRTVAGWPPRKRPAHRARHARNGWCGKELAAPRRADRRRFCRGAFRPRFLQLPERRVVLPPLRPAEERPLQRVLQHGIRAPVVPAPQLRDAAGDPGLRLDLARPDPARPGALADQRIQPFQLSAVTGCSPPEQVLRMMRTPHAQLVLAMAGRNGKAPLDAGAGLLFRRGLRRAGPGPGSRRSPGRSPPCGRAGCRAGRGPRGAWHPGACARPAPGPISAIRRSRVQGSWRP